MSPEDAFPIVCMFGDRVMASKYPLRDIKALLLFVGMSESPMLDLAAAFGVPEDIVEAVYEDMLMYAHDHAERFPDPATITANRAELDAQRKGLRIVS